MLSATFRRTAVLFLLVAVLAAPWASAASPRAERPGRVRAAQPARLDFISRTWSVLAEVWEKIGCNIDPSGRCIPGENEESPASQTEIGCHIDPSGRCNS